VPPSLRKFQNYFSGCKFDELHITLLVCCHTRSFYNQTHPCAAISPLSSCGGEGWGEEAVVKPSQLHHTIGSYIAQVKGLAL
jgi:hypothetical protein